MQSHSIKIKPIDSRCRYWAKIIRAGEDLPLPADVTGSNDLPVPYHQRGDEELLPGDVLFEGEENHHRRSDRGWSYYIRAVREDGSCLSLRSGFSKQKAELKAQGMPTELLKGAGDVAAMVRIAHGLRLGLTVADPEEN
jgi:hypothetical protein